MNDSESTKIITDSEEVNIEKLSFCDPRRHFRWLVLIFICFLTFGSYFSYDNPAALAVQISMPQPYGMNLTNFQNTLLYSIYSWPNTILAFFGGVLVDKWLGLRLGGFLFSLFICIGQIVTAFGAQFNSFIVMMIGRFIFGLGGENLAVVQNAYTVKYFSGKELNLVFGLALSISRVGSTVNFNVSPPIAWIMGLGPAFWLGAIFCGLSTIIALVLWRLDKKRDSVIPPKVRPVEKISFRYILEFPATFWLVCFICVFIYIAIFPFIDVAAKFIAYKWIPLSAQAATIDGLPYLISGFASPVFGFIVDRAGFNPLFCTFAVVAVAASHLLLMFSTLTPYVGFVFFGVAYSLTACALWPMVGYLVPEEQLGTAYGIMQALQNLGLAIAAPVAGMLQDKDATFFLPDMFFVGSSSIGVALLCCILLIFADIAGRRQLMHGAKALVVTREKMNDLHEAKYNVAVASEPLLINSSEVMEGKSYGTV